MLNFRPMKSEDVAHDDAMQPGLHLKPFDDAHPPLKVVGLALIDGRQSYFYVDLDGIKVVMHARHKDEKDILLRYPSTNLVLSILVGLSYHMRQEELIRLGFESSSAPQHRFGK